MSNSSRLTPSWRGYYRIKKLMIFGDSYSHVGYSAQAPVPTSSSPLGVAFPGQPINEPGRPNWVGYLIRDHGHGHADMTAYNYARQGDTVTGVYTTQISREFLPTVGRKSQWAAWGPSDSIFIVSWVGANDRRIFALSHRTSLSLPLPIPNSKDRTTTDFFVGSPLSALTMLSFSDNIDLQRSAAQAFSVITDTQVRPVGRDTLNPILHLLSSYDSEVQRAASAALGNLAVKTENKLLIVRLGGLEHLMRQMLSPDVELQCNAARCVSNLATHDDNKIKIAKSGTLLLTRLARSKDTRVQRNATGALLSMTHSDENRQHLVHAGAIPALVSLLSSPGTDVQYYGTAVLSNIAVDGSIRKILARTEPKLVIDLVRLMGSASLKVQCQAALALRNLASDENYQLEIVEANGLQHLLRLLQSTYPPHILSSVACLCNVSNHFLNDTPIIESGLLQPLINILSFKGYEEAQFHAISTLRNLAADSERSKIAIVKAGMVHSVIKLVSDVSMNVQTEIAACVAVLALSDDLKGQLLEMGICEVLIPLTNSPNSEVQGNSAAALGNLSYYNGRATSDVYSALDNVWAKPEGGMHQYLNKFLGSPDVTFQHIAIWTVLQLLELRDPQLMKRISSSNLLIPKVRQLAVSRSEADDDKTDLENDRGEIQELARKSLNIVMSTYETLTISVG